MKTYNRIGLFLALIGVTILVLSVSLDGCKRYDDTPICEELNELKTLVEKLDDWCKNTNSQITALQALVHALENNDYITEVTPIMEGSKEIGYTIYFNERKPIRIPNGEDGKDGIVPKIGVKKEADGKQYWTVQIGTGPVEYILDDAGQKVPVIGADAETGVSPTINVATYDGTNTSFIRKLCWKVNGEFLLADGNPVVAAGVDRSLGATGATGAQGDSIFKENGISIDKVNGTVTFTLADGTSMITLPLISKLTISIVEGNSTKIISLSSHLLNIKRTGSY